MEGNDQGSGRRPVPQPSHPPQHPSGPRGGGSGMRENQTGKGCVLEATGRRPRAGVCAAEGTRALALAEIKGIISVTRDKVWSPTEPPLLKTQTNKQNPKNKNNPSERSKSHGYKTIQMVRGPVGKCLSP